jgi:hypothetical protein
MTPTFFASPAHFRKWLRRHAGEAQELLVGLYKAGPGKPSITWPESVDDGNRVGDQCQEGRGALEASPYPHRDVGAGEVDAPQFVRRKD